MDKVTKSEVRLTTHGPINPFKGFTFKMVTYNKHHQEIKSQVVKIESQLELKTTLDEIKQFNIDNENPGNGDYKKLITE